MLTHNNTGNLVPRAIFLKTRKDNGPLCRRDDKGKKVSMFHSKENSGLGVIHDEMKD